MGLLLIINESQWMEPFIHDDIGGLKKAIKKQDWVEFEELFNLSVKNANDYHKAADKPLIIWKLPEFPPPIYLTTRRAVECMEPGSRVVLLSSTAGQRGEADHSHYAATKGGIISFCKSLATELGPRGITVNAVAPGWVDTDMSSAVLRSPERAQVESEIPLRRIASAEDVAGPICFLLSDLARHVTGEVLNVNGGSVLCG